MSEHMDDAQRIGWQAAATVAYDQGVADGVAKERDRCLAIAREVFGSEIARMIESGEAP
jgi:hypothetical protein